MGLSWLFYSTNHLGVDRKSYIFYKLYSNFSQFIIPPRRYLPVECAGVWLEQGEGWVLHVGEKNDLETGWKNSVFIIYNSFRIIQSTTWNYLDHWIIELYQPLWCWPQNLCFTIYIQTSPPQMWLWLLSVLVYT